MGWHVSGYKYYRDESAPTGRRARIESAGPGCDGYVVNGPNGTICSIDRGGPLALADARLIASAPDLLASLTAVIPFAARQTAGTTDGGPVISEANATIARADGAA